MALPKIKENVVENQSICICQNQNIVSDTVDCSHKSCAIKAYHLSCLGIEVCLRDSGFVHTV